MQTLEPIVQTLEELAQALGDKITLNQGLEIANRFEQAVEEKLAAGVPEDSYDLGPIYEKIINEVVGA